MFLLLCSLLVCANWQELPIDTRSFFLDRVVALQVYGDHFYMVAGNKRTLYGHLIFKVNRQGGIVKSMTSNGSGPGVVQSIRNISVADDRVYVAESMKPVLHIYDLDLNHIRDVKLQSGGHILVNNTRYVGIWRTVYGSGGAHMLSLYAKPDLEPVKRIFPYRVKDQAYLVQQWGGAASGPGNTIAGILVHDYRPRLYDPENETYRDLVKIKPTHIVAMPWLPKQESEMRPKDDRDWLSSWHIVHGLYFSEGRFVVSWRWREQYYFDVINQSGEFLARKILSETPVLDLRDGYLWRIVEREDEHGDKYFVIAGTNLSKLVNP
jgi:hypothetical protein